jgi:pilus assembly protein CpaB
MQRPGTIFLLSIVLGALFSALVYRYLKEQQSQLDTARKAKSGETVSVVVADEAIPVGTLIEPGRVRIVQWPIDLDPEGAARATEDVAGSIARTSIERNQPILKSSLIPKGAGLLPLLITDGMRGISVKVDSVTGVSGFITPNSRVDVLVSGTPEIGGNQEQRSKLILQNIRVLATGTTIEQKDEKPVDVPTVTLLVTPADAERLTLAARQEPVRLALRNYRDEELTNTPGIGTRALFASSSEGVVAKQPDKTRRDAGGSVQVLLGDKVTRQPLF